MRRSDVEKAALRFVRTDGFRSVVRVQENRGPIDFTKPMEALGPLATVAIFDVYMDIVDGRVRVERIVGPKGYAFEDEVL